MEKKAIIGGGGDGLEDVTDAILAMNDEVGDHAPKAGGALSSLTGATA